MKPIKLAILGIICMHALGVFASRKDDSSGGEDAAAATAHSAGAGVATETKEAAHTRAEENTTPKRIVRIVDIVDAFGSENRNFSSILGKLSKKFGDNPLLLPVIDGKQFGFTTFKPGHCLFEVIKRAKRKKVLELGAGVGLTAGQVLLAGASSLTAVEIHHESVGLIEENIGSHIAHLPVKPEFKAFGADISKPFPPELKRRGPFDVIYSQNVLHYMTPSAVMATLRNARELATDNTSLVITVNAPSSIVFETFKRAEEEKKLFPGYMARDYDLRGEHIASHSIDESEGLELGYHYPDLYAKRTSLTRQISPKNENKSSFYHKAAFYIDKATFARMLNDAGWEIESIEYAVGHNRGELASYDHFPAHVWTASKSEECVDLLVIAKPKSTIAVSSSSSSPSSSSSSSAAAQSPPSSFSSSPSSTQPACMGCGKATGGSRCTRCRAANYCGRACQTAHWPVHKKSCKKR
jgi:16S rRNA G966 N2-methylase RsmD